jgi:Terpene cyclase DEP1
MLVRLKSLYLIAAVIGAIVPYATYFGYLQAAPGISGALSLAWATPIAAATLADFTISCLVFWVFVFAESKRLNLKYAWFFVLTNLVIGLSFALPAFLYFRERASSPSGCRPN